MASRSNSFSVLTDVRVVNEPESRQIGEKTLVSFTVADNPGDDKSETKFIRITTSGKLAEVMSQLKKGDRINAVGKETYTTYNKKDGTTGVGFDIKFPMSVTRVFTDQLKSEPVAEPVFSEQETPAKKKPGRPKKVVEEKMPWEDDEV